MPGTNARTAGDIGAYARSGGQFGGFGDAAHNSLGLREPVSLDGWGPLWTGLARVGGVLPPPVQPDADPWALLRGREHPSRRGRADGRLVRTTGSRLRAAGPRFDVRVDAQGYAWWYIDATSDDERHGLTIIAFVGSVFSPYYKLSGRGDPDNHCAINVALNGPRGGCWAMTERPRKSVSRSADHFAAGPSSVHWDGNALVVEISEISAPIPYRVKGRIRVIPELLGDTAFMLDPAGKHRWHPVAPRARVEVEMKHPGVSWSGPGYFDSNFGDEPLETGFIDWHWSRAHLKDRVAVMYEGTRRDGTPFDLALQMDRQGNWDDVCQPPGAPLPRSNWLVERRTRADRGHDPRVLKTWIVAPFYARTALATRLYGEDVRAVHESLSLARFRSPIVQSMLPYRMPRAFR